MSSPISPVKVSDLNFIPELFFDLIARILPGSLVIALAYIYIDFFSKLSSSNSQANLKFNIFSDFFSKLLSFPSNHGIDLEFNILENIPIWFAPIIAYYTSIALTAILLCAWQDFAEEIEELNCRIYQLTYTAPEDRARFLKIISELNGSCSITSGFSFIWILAIFFKFFVYNKNQLQIQEEEAFCYLIIIHSILLIAFAAWGIRLKNILRERLNHYEKYKKLLLREDWTEKFCIVPKQNKIQVERFQVFKKFTDYYLVISPDEVNSYADQVIAIPTIKSNKYPTHVDCKFKEGNEDKTLTFALDKISSIERIKLGTSCSHINSEDQKVVLETLAKLFS